MNFVKRRNGWSSAKRNNEVGPAGGGVVIGCVGTASIFIFLRGADAVGTVPFEFETNVGASCTANLHEWIRSELFLIHIPTQLSKK